MRSFIQLTDTDNDILRSLPLGDLSSTTTYIFRVWNNLPQYGGIAAINNFKLDIAHPPKQGIKTLINEDIIQIRCLYSGKHSETLNSSFQTFPISGDSFNRLEPNCYNEYEVQIDFSDLSVQQKLDVEGIEMEFNVIATYDYEYVPMSLPNYREVLSNTVIEVLEREIMDVLSNTRVLVAGTEITSTSDSTIV